MDIENVVQRLRAMNADGVGYVGHAADVIEELQKKLSESESFIAAIADTCEHAERVAAESQARENGMTEALRRIAMNISGDTVPQVIAGDALERTSDDTALKQMLVAEFNKGYERGCSGYHEGLKIALAAERERCEKACRQLEVHDAGHPGTAFKVQGMCIDAIRALGVGRP